MAKLSSASIRLVMKKNRMNRNGEYPIYLVVCFSGRVEKATVRGAASLLSRSASTISVYIHSLQHDKDIADAVSFLDD